jgi:hypothetical protein
MSNNRLFKSTIDDQDYLHLQLAHNVYKIEYELYGDDNSLHKGIHINKGGSCCLSFPVKSEVQYFIKFMALIKESHLSLFHDSSRTKYKKERIEFTKFYKVDEPLEKKEEEIVEEAEEENIYTNIEKAGLDFSTFFENSIADNESESTSHKLVSLFRNVREDVTDYDLGEDSDTESETIGDIESVEVKSDKSNQYSEADDKLINLTNILAAEEA